MESNLTVQDILFSAFTVKFSYEISLNTQKNPHFKKKFKF